jgi:hypothetical protein
MKKLATIALTVALVCVAANAAPIEDIDGNMKIRIDLADGSMAIVNESGAPLVWSALNIISTRPIIVPDANELDANWNPILVAGFWSVSDQQAAFGNAHIGANLGGPALGSFIELPGNEFQVSEGVLQAGINFAVLQDGNEWSLGTPIIPGTAAVTPGGNFDVFYATPSSGAEKFRVTNYEIIGGPTGHKGDGPGNPVMPNGPGQGGQDPDGRWRFQNFDVTDNNGEGLWFDPPFVSAYLYETDGNSNFTKVMLPSAGDDMYVVTWGTGAGDWAIVAASVQFEFPIPVESFKVSAIDPLADAGDALGFPTFLAFDEPVVTFTQLGIPEPATMGLMLFGAIGMIARKRRRS